MSSGENPDGGTKATTGCTAPKSAGSVERVVPASAMSSTELGASNVASRTVGGGAAGATDGGTEGSEVTAAGAVGGGTTRAGRPGAGRLGGGGVVPWAGGGCAGGGGCVVGAGGCVVGGGGCVMVVVVVGRTVVVGGGSDVVDAGAVVVGASPAASALPAHSKSANRESVRPEAVTRARERALRRCVSRNMCLERSVDAVDSAMRPARPARFVPPSLR